MVASGVRRSWERAASTAVRTRSACRSRSPCCACLVNRSRSTASTACAAKTSTSARSAGADWLLALYGRPLTPADRALVEVFAAQAVLAVERDRLTRQAQQGERLRQADRVRTAVLAALSHDLRTPLATIKASVSS